MTSSEWEWMRCGIVCLWMAGACAGEADPPDQFTARVRVETDVRDPVPGVHVQLNGRVAGVTDQDGTLTVPIRGRVGERVVLDAVCPNGYRSAHGRRELRLRRVDQLTPSPGSAHALTLQCVPRMRHAVLVVRVTGATVLPIRVNDAIVAHTNAAGVAHVPFSLAPDTDLQVTIDTTQSPMLRPAHPSQRFHMEDRDAILVFDQALAHAPSPKTRERTRTRVTDRPYRLD